MVGYQVIEPLVIQALINMFPSWLSADNVKAGDLDAIFDDMLSNNKTYGCLVEYDAGVPDHEVFRRGSWRWSIGGIFFIRYDSNIETNLRSVLTPLAQLFDSDPDLGGMVVLAKIVSIGTPEPAQVNDIPFYWLPFLVHVYDHLIGGD